MPRVLVAALLCGLWIFPPLASAETREVRDAAAFQKAVADARPGDTILVAPGDYDRNVHFRSVRGTDQQPIVIRALDPKRPPRFVGGTAPLHFSGAGHLELRDLVITGAAGNGLNIDDGNRPDQPSRRITLRNLQIRDIGPDGNKDGLKLSGVVDFLVENCTVERWGSGGSAIDMVGCRRGVVTGCRFHKGGANGVQAKGGSSEITIRRCRFEEAGERGVNLGGSTGDDSFRPPLTEFPADGKYEAKALRVEGCTFVGGGAAVAFVGVDGATVRHSTIYHPGRYVVRILQEKSAPGFVPCRGGVFERNIVVFRSDSWVTGGFNIGGNTDPGSFRFAGNLWYCEDRPDRSAPKPPTAETGAVIGLDPRFVDPTRGDFTVAADSPAADRGAHALPQEGAAGASPLPGR